ncbi:Histone deacetylase [Cercospora zeina]
MEDDPQDVSMSDGEVIRSTEAYPSLLAQSGGDFTGKQAIGAPPHADTLLKGKGIRRGSHHAFDHQLVARKDGPKPAKFEHLPYGTLQTGLVYDVRMRFHAEAEPSEDDLHPEDPRRIHAIFEAFVNAGLAWRDGTSANDYYMGRIDARMVTRDEVCLVHTRNHWDWVRSLSAMNSEQLREERQHPDHANDSIYLSNSTPLCAALSAGGAIEACRAIILGKVKNAFAVIRPPGHHAEREDAKGFCFYDNVSIATKACQKEFGDQCRKVMILDWDVHHGNGIQEANYDDPNVLYISLHVHKKGLFYPEKSYRDQRQAYGDHLHCGRGEGLGKNVNIPWTKQGMGDADYLYAFQQVVMPIATEFNPDLVIVAAGFDAAQGDMLGGCDVTPAGYAHMTHMLMSLADGKLAVCLEGGYNLESIARSATAVARTLMGEPPDRLENPVATISCIDDVKLVVRQQSRFWTCLYPKDMSERLKGPLRGERMHNVVRAWQAKTMWEEYEMTPLFVHREKLAKEFEDQVLATPNYSTAQALFIVIHDPPEVLASPDPRTGKIELHNTWLTYVDSAYKEGFAIIDVNLPKYVTDYNQDSREHQSSQSVDHRNKEAEQLLKYLWDNYVELGESTYIYLMGTNAGHGVIINFLKSNEEMILTKYNDREEDHKLLKAITFVEDVPLMSCRPLVSRDDELPQWYYRNSLVLVGSEHAYFESDFSRKPKRKFGRVIKSDSNTITDMLLQHKDAVFEILLEDADNWRSAKQAEIGADEMDYAKPSPLASPKKLPSGALSPTNLAGLPAFSLPVGENGSGSPRRLPQ